MLLIFVLMLQNFKSPLRHSGLMSEDEIDTIFEHLNLIYNVNSSLYK